MHELSNSVVFANKEADMRTVMQAVVAALAAAAGVVATLFSCRNRGRRAASNDRFQDFIMATGAVSVNPKIQTDGVWLLDYKSGKLLGTVIDRNQGKIVGWAEVDLRAEFGLAAQADVHFMMTTGYITQGQSALYLAETSTGQFGVYTMGPGQNGATMTIRRHDLTRFRQQAAGQGNALRLRQEYGGRHFPRNGSHDGMRSRPSHSLTIWTGDAVEFGTFLDLIPFACPLICSTLCGTGINQCPV